jgi:hypothetical protein
LYIDTLQQVECDIMYITTEYTTNHNPLVVYRHLTTGGFHRIKFCEIMDQM